MATNLARPLTISSKLPSFSLRLKASEDILFETKIVFPGDPATEMTPDFSHSFLLVLVKISVGSYRHPPDFPFRRPSFRLVGSPMWGAWIDLTRLEVVD